MTTAAGALVPVAEILMTKAGLLAALIVIIAPRWKLKLIAVHLGAALSALLLWPHFQSFPQEAVRPIDLAVWAWAGLFIVALHSALIARVIRGPAIS